jgi:hypothetical protein
MVPLGAWGVRADVVAHAGWVSAIASRAGPGCAAVVAAVAVTAASRLAASVDADAVVKTAHNRLFTRDTISPLTFRQGITSF